MLCARVCQINRLAIESSRNPYSTIRWSHSACLELETKRICVALDFSSFLDQTKIARFLANVWLALPAPCSRLAD
jgi:hypothetical protein